MPRPQSQHHHSHSTQLHHPTPAALVTPLRSKTKPTMKPFHLPQPTSATAATPVTTAVTPKKASTTPHKPISTKSTHPHLQKSHKPKRKNAPKSLLTPNPPKNLDTLSLLSFYDSSAALYSLSSHSSSKLTSLTRKPKKNSANRHVLVLPRSIDSEEVHSIFLPRTNCSSRSTTPTPTKSSQLTPSDNLDDPSLALALDDLYLPSPPAELKSTPPRTLPTTSTPAPSSGRGHVRAKSVASIFQLDKPPPSSKAPSLGARDNWDMPTVHPTRDPTWQQKEKKKSSSSPPPSRTTQNDPLKSSTRTITNQPSKEARPVCFSKSTLVRTSSAGTISRLVPSNAQTSKPMTSSRSDDESALTWQQTIIRPLPKPKPSSSAHPNQVLNLPENQLGGHKKTQGTPNSLRTPNKCLPSTRKAGVHSAVKSKSSSLQPTCKRRNSLSSTQTFHSLEKPDPTLAPTQSIASVVGSAIAHSAPSWTSFPSSTVGNHRPDLPPLRTDPLPIAGAQVEQTPPRRHTKSYTLQPASLPMRSTTQSSLSHAIPTGFVSTNIPEPTSHKTMSTPSKSRSTSEDLNSASPEKQFATPALRAAFMYAGPQFHNSPCPAALPAPKFSFGSA